MINSFWKYNSADIFQQIKSSENGLSDQDAADRLRAFPTKKKQIAGWKKDVILFLSQYKSPLTLMLVAAVILSALTGSSSDVIIILFILLATGTLSFIQERNAGRTVEKLQAMIAVKCSIMRNGVVADIPADQIVPGDIILIKAGDIVPADCLLLEANELYSNEASLTGESFPVRKEPGVVDENTALAKRINCLWQGSSISSGTGKAVIINTGSQTVFGSIEKSISKVTETAFERGIRRFGFFLMQVTLVLSVAILTINLLFHKPVVDSLLFALALAVGMAPELLPAINAIAMSAGARRLLKQKVIVKKLSAIQNLGEVNLLCSDKTGTITQGIIQIARSCDAGGNDSNYVQQLAYINAFYESGYTNPIDDALRKLSLTLPPDIKKIGEIPYDFLRKRLTIVISRKQEIQLVTKGAVNEILSICNSALVADDKTEPIASHLDKINDCYNQFGIDGFRVLGVCYKNISSSQFSKGDEKDMVFAGFILLQDPLKEGLQNALHSLQELNVNIKIITGDNKVVATSIGKKIGLQSPSVLSGDEMLQMTSEALVQKARTTDIFAEVEPQQKEMIIQALKKNFTVAYMGDGINDVAAINASDVGISVDDAVDVAKSAADFVLLENDLCVLADGIREGRKTFLNTLKYIFINTGATFGNMFSVAFASIMLPFLPMLPAQILLTNFLTDIPYLAIATDNVDPVELQQSSKWNIKLIRSYMVIFGLHSSLFDIATFIILYSILKVSATVFQTGWFFESVLTELFVLFIMRTKKSFIKSNPSKLLLWLSLAAFIFTVALPYLPINSSFGMTPLQMTLLASLSGVVFIYVITADMLKIWFFKKMAAKY